MILANQVTVTVRGLGLSFCVSCYVCVASVDCSWCSLFLSNSVACLSYCREFWRSNFYHRSSLSFIFLCHLSTSVQWATATDKKVEVCCGKFCHQVCVRACVRARECLCVRVRVYACVCVCERERERERAVSYTHLTLPTNHRV